MNVNSKGDLKWKLEFVAEKAKRKRKSRDQPYDSEYSNEDASFRRQNTRPLDTLSSLDPSRDLSTPSQPVDLNERAIAAESRTR